MNQLPFIQPESSHATAVTISRGEMHLEPVRILNGQWCIRRDGHLVPANPDKIDGFVMPDKTVDDGVSQWRRLSRYLADRGLVVPGDRDAIAAALTAGHWGQHRVPVERHRGRGSDSGVGATLARGVQQKEAA